jgi:hypothetical protein
MKDTGSISQEQKGGERHRIPDGNEPKRSGVIDGCCFYDRETLIDIKGGDTNGNHQAEKVE